MQAQTKKKFGIKVYTDFEYNAQDLLGTTLMIVDSFNTQKVLLITVEILLLIAFIFIALLALTSTGALAERLQEFYSLDYLPEITLFMFNGAFWFILFVIMMVAPLSLLFTMRRFSAKHIAKKLKED